jgi:hypothetical protein
METSEPIKKQQEDTMRKQLTHRRLLAIGASVVLTIAGSMTPSASQTAGNALHKRIVRHNPPGNDISSFSSSSLHVGVNHPPKNR